MKSEIVLPIIIAAFLVVMAFIAYLFDKHTKKVLNRALQNFKILQELRKDGRYNDFDNDTLLRWIKNARKTGSHVTGIAQDVHGAIYMLKKKGEWNE